MTGATAAPLLEMRDITKRFGNVTALRDVNLTVRHGEIHAICGENGAGKSTLMKVLSGIYPHGSYQGEIVFDGQPGEFKDIRSSERHGIGIIHQELALVPVLSIAENIFLGNEHAAGGIINWHETMTHAQTLLDRVGLGENPQTRISDIGVGKQQLVEIAKALSKKVKLLILDEPTAALNDEDSRHLLDLIVGLAAQGLACIIISHKLNEVMRVADRITILRDGQTIETRLVEPGLTEEHIIRGMVGRDMSDRFPPRGTHPIGDVTLAIEDWTVFHPLDQQRKVVDRISINVRRGEVVGLAGGNQQKVVLSKWIFADPDVLILDEPTRGIDVGAKYEIYTIINSLASQGKSIIVISSELPELIGLCDRIYTLNEGRLTGEVARADASQETLMHHMMKGPNT